MSTQENQETVSNELLIHAKNLEQIILEFAKFDVLSRKTYERKIKNLAQLSINKGIDIEDLAKEINQQKKNDILFEETLKEIDVNKNNIQDKEKDINLIEINNISNQIFCKDYYRNLLKYMQRKKEALKIANLLNNTNKIIHSTNNNVIQNKYKNQMEQNYKYDPKANNINSDISKEHNKSSSKSLGRKRKLK